MVALLFFALPMLKVEVARVTAYDGLVLGVLGALVLGNLLRWSGVRRGVSWWPQGPGRFYGWHVALLVVGLLSGLDTHALVPWGVELATFVYMTLMVVTMDALLGRRLEEALRIGGWVFAGLMIFAGAGAVLGMLGVMRIELLYPSIGGVTSEKFSGFARAANQWAAYVLAFQPLLMALMVKERRLVLRGVALAGVVLGFLTLPASGSRTGLLLGVMQVATFVGIYLLGNRSAGAGRKVGVVLVVGLLTLGLVSAFSIFAEDSWVVRRALSAFDTVESGGARVSGDWRAKNFAWAFQEIERHPFFGVGLGTFATLYDRHEVHSTYLSLWAEGGPLMLLSWVGLFLTTLYRQALALVKTIRLKQDNLILIGMMVAVGSQLLFGFTHNTTRTRSTALVVWLGLMWAEVVLARLRALPSPSPSLLGVRRPLREPLGGSGGRAPASPR